MTISPDYPDLSVTPDGEQMKAFKYNGEYNIYNLLNGAGYDEWDPLNQKDYMPTGTWNIQFDYPGIAKDVVPFSGADKTGFSDNTGASNILGVTVKCNTFFIPLVAVATRQPFLLTVILRAT